MIPGGGLLGLNLPAAVFHGDRFCELLPAASPLQERSLCCAFVVARTRLALSRQTRVDAALPCRQHLVELSELHYRQGSQGTWSKGNAQSGPLGKSVIVTCSFNISEKDGGRPRRGQGRIVGLRHFETVRSEEHQRMTSQDEA